MQWQTFRERFRKDGWLMIALAAAVIACLLLGMAENASTGATEEEARLSRVLSAIEGAGQVEVAVFYDENAQDGEKTASVPVGAVVVAQGADDVAVRIRLIRAVTTLTGLDNAKVEVFRGESK